MNDKGESKLKAYAVNAHFSCIMTLLFTVAMVLFVCFILFCSRKIEDKFVWLLSNFRITVVLVSLVIIPGGIVAQSRLSGLKGELESIRVIVPEMANISKCLDDYIALDAGIYTAQLDIASDLASSAQIFMLLLLLFGVIPIVIVIGCYVKSYPKYLDEDCDTFDRLPKD